MNASKDPPFHVLDEEGSTDLLVIAGEASGDEHAAHLSKNFFYGVLTLRWFRWEGLVWRKPDQALSMT